MKKSVVIIALFASVVSIFSSCAVRADYGYRNHPYRHYGYYRGY